MSIGVRTVPVFMIGMMKAIALPLSAQTIPSNIVPDATLGSESSEVTSNNQFDLITGGAERGQNLFHSFREFNVSASRGGFFLVPNNAIQNVLARVTGRNPSEILGTLGTVRIQNNRAVPSPANLFLINPNGIIFGENSSLDIGGSFTATTTNAIQFGERGNFSASQPALPSSVLTVDPSALLYTAISPQTTGIIQRSTRTQNNRIGVTTGLQVAAGKSLLLVGGDIVLDGGLTTVKGGRIELGGLAETGTIGLNLVANQVRLTFADQTRSNITLTNGAEVRVLPVGESGEINVHARNLNILEQSGLSVGEQFSGANAGFRGNIALDISEAMNIADSSFIFNIVKDGLARTGGGIEIAADSLQGDTAAGISAATIGKANSGNLTIRVKDNLTLARSAVAVTRVVEDATGNAGDVNITAGSLTLIDGGQIQSGTRGKGDAGNVILTVRNLFFANGEFSFGRSSGILTTVEPFAIGRGGNIQVTTGSLRFSNGAQIVASTRGQGDAGNIKLTALDRISFDGKGEDTAPTGVFSNVNLNSTGRGGTIEINANTLGITNGAQLQAFTRGKGDAGNFIFRVMEAIVLDGQGFDQKPSAITSSVENPSAIGNSGSIDLQTGFLIIRNGALISTSVQGQGKGGNILINAPNILLDGESQQGASSTIESVLGANAVGKGGNIRLDSNILAIIGGANLEARTFGIGDAGNVELNASDRIVLSRGDVFTAVQAGATGRGGDITVNTGSISFLNASQFVASTRGTGDSGNIKITARDRVLFSGGLNPRENTTSGAFSSVDTGAVGQGGKIDITAGSLSVLNGAQINALTRGKGDAGGVSINVKDAMVLSGRGLNRSRSAINSTSELQAEGNGGDIRITASSLSLRGNAVIETGSSTRGNSGTIALNIRGLFQLEDSSVSSSSFRSSGGSVDVTAGRIQLRQSSNITTNILEGAGSGGNIDLTARSIVALEGSDILAFAEDGKGGNITLNTRAFFGQNYRPTPSGINLFSLQFNDRVDINASGAVSGVITLPDTTFIQNSLNPLPQSAIDTNTLLANSCIARNQQNGSFYITGSSGLPINPGEISNYPTGTVQATTWKRGDPIIEPQGVYQLPNGQLLLSRECE
jgi:filamentous hemagglutinin family protein